MACALVIAAAAAASPSAGAPDKPFALVVTPSSFSASQETTVTATFTNETKTQQLGSANLTAPAGFTLLSASVPAPGTATVVGNVVELRDLSLASGSSVSVSIGVRTACAGADSSSWSVIAKQANNFSGSPGNDLNLDDANSSLSATVTGFNCVLRFVTQPHDAYTSQTITGTAHNPGGSPPSVEITDPGGSRLTSSTAPVTLSLGGPGAGSLHGTKTVAAVNGLASFPGLSVDAAGSYLLTASSPGFSPVSSSSFDVANAPVPPVGHLPIEQLIVLFEAAGLPPPEYGRTVNVTAVNGTITVTLPDGSQIRVTAPQSIPVGSIIDTSGGALGLQSARGPTGGVQFGIFFGGKFKLVQKKKLRHGQRRHTTDLRLTGGVLVSCPAGGTKAEAARRRRRRHLWGSASGSFRSVGENSAATVRGTKWLVKDTCAGTLTRVRRGVVVVHDFHTGKNIKLKTGQIYLAHF